MPRHPYTDTDLDDPDAPEIDVLVAARARLEAMLRNKSPLWRHVWADGFAQGRGDGAQEVIIGLLRHLGDQSLFETIGLIERRNVPECEQLAIAILEGGILAALGLKLSVRARLTPRTREWRKCSRRKARVSLPIQRNSVR